MRVSMAYVKTTVTWHVSRLFEPTLSAKQMVFSFLSLFCCVYIVHGCDPVLVRMYEYSLGWRASSDDFYANSELNSGLDDDVGLDSGPSPGRASSRDCCRHRS